MGRGANHDMETINVKTGIKTGEFILMNLVWQSVKFKFKNQGSRL
jgi:hypothetical protein